MRQPFTSARWIWTADDPIARLAVRRFRGSFDIDENHRITCHISADSRYELYLDGRLIGRGPARSDLRNYIYDTYEFFVDPGRHTFAATVVAYDGDTGPFAEIHDHGAFLLEAHTETGETIAFTGTDGSWRVQRDSAYTPLFDPQTRKDGWYAIGAMEKVDGARIPHDWTDPGFDDGDWEVPGVSLEASVRGAWFGDTRWRLTPRDIPAMKSIHAKFDNAASELPLTIAPGETRAIVLDSGAYSIGYPEVHIDGGLGGSVRIEYAEALREDGVKRRRDFYEGGTLSGLYDIYHPGGGDEVYRPLHWRAFRFVKITAAANDQPLTIAGASFEATGYPWERKASFLVESESAQIQRIQDIDFRTLECCTWETFMDCPHYEQLQYVGDTRLQALLSYVTTGDTRLGRRAVRQFDSSRLPGGLTQSRYPSNVEQVIPPFSLLWILMVEDLWRYSPSDADTVAKCLGGCRGVLEWFGGQLTSEGVVGGALPYWPFVDWTWRQGVPPPVCHGQQSASINLMYLAALQAYIRLQDGLGDAREAEFWQAEADMLADAITLTFWDADADLLREGPTGQWGYTQHAQAWGILTGLIPEHAIPSVVESLHFDDRLAKTTYYHTFYVVEALAKVGRLERLWSHWLAPWREALALGFTTWPEKPEPTRSDCHAWSSWPTYAFLTHVLGVRQGDAAGTIITPLKVDGWDRVSGVVALPSGTIQVSIDWRSGQPAIDIDRAPIAP